MALFRKFFYRKPPDHLLEISERVYVFDCCFSTDVLEEDEYKDYIGGIVAQLQDHFPDASIMVFNFREGERRSQISDTLAQYDMTVMEYPRQYEGCPLLPLEVIHHFLRSSESWLSLEGQQNVLLMHCDRGGWPVLAFMLAGLLLYRKQYNGEQKTLEMVYKQAPRELLQLLSPLNPQPSHLRYLQYISRRNLGSEWPPSETPLFMDCLILRDLPLYDDGTGCRPVVRVYGPDPSKPANRSSKLLLSTSKNKKHIRHYQQAECMLVKIDIHCRVQGDVVLECIHLSEDFIREEMMFRVMFHTAFVRSNILMLSRDDIDIIWDAKEQLPKDFKSEVLFLDADAVIPNLTTVIVSGDENESESASPDEFYEVEEIFSNALDAQEGKGEYGSKIVHDSTVDDGSHKDIGKEYLDPHTFQDFTLDDGSHKQVGRMDSGINVVKDITIDDVKYKLDEIEDSDPLAVKDIAVDEGEIKSTPDIVVDEGEIKPTPSAVTFDKMKTLETKEVTVNVHDELAVMQNKYDEDINAIGKESGSKEGQQNHDLSASKFDKPHPSTEKKHLSSHSKPIGDTVATKQKNKPHETHGFEAKHAKPNATTRWIPSNKGSYQDSMHILYPYSRPHNPPAASSNALSPKEKMTDAKGRSSSFDSHGPGAVVSIDKTNDLKSRKRYLSKSADSIAELDSPQSLLHFIKEASLEPTTQALTPPPPPSPPPPPPPPPPPLLGRPPPTLPLSSRPNDGINVQHTTSPPPPPSPPPNSFPEQSRGSFLPHPTLWKSVYSSIPTLGENSGASPPPPTSPFTISARGITSKAFELLPIVSLPHPQPPPLSSKYGVPSIPPPPPLLSTREPSLPPPSTPLFESFQDPPSPTFRSDPSRPPPPPPLPSLLDSHRVSSPLPSPPPAPPPPPPSPLSKSQPPSAPPPPLREAQRPPPPSSLSGAPPPPPHPPPFGRAPQPLPPSSGAPPASSQSPLPPSSGATHPPPPPPLPLLSGAPPPSVFGTPSPPPPPTRGVPPPPPPSTHGALPPLPPPPMHGAPPPSPLPGGRGPPPPPPMHGAPPPPPLPGGQGPPPPPPPGGRGPPSPPPARARAPGAPAPPRLPGGAPPPPPGGADPRGRGRGLARPSGASAMVARRSSLKPLHWSKVTRALQGSLWEELQRNGEPHIAQEFDVSELEKLFSANVPKPADSGGKSGGQRKSAGSKSDKVHLIELRRANNTEIMLTKVKMPLPDMMAAVLAMDESVLDVDQVENLIKFCPTKEEMELLKGYTGDLETLGKCEQYFLELMKVPRVESKLRVFCFKIQFGSQITEFKKSLNTVNSACDEVRNSIKLKEIMKKILYLGNTLNQGTARGSAVGFKLDSLLKLTDTRASNSKMTLMHYLCKVLAERSPEQLDFHLDLVCLEAATKIQLKSLAEEMQAIIKGLEKVKQELAASENDGPVSDVFRKTLKEFISVAESEVASVTNIYSVVGRNADALALYFGEDPARCPLEQVTVTLLNFTRLFLKAHEENIKQAELEKKKAEKEAEMEKAKGLNPTRKSEKEREEES